MAEDKTVRQKALSLFLLSFPLFFFLFAPTTLQHSPAAFPPFSPWAICPTGKPTALPGQQTVVSATLYKAGKEGEKEGKRNKTYFLAGMSGREGSPIKKPACENPKFPLLLFHIPFPLLLLCLAEGFFPSLLFLFPAHTHIKMAPGYFPISERRKRREWGKRSLSLFPPSPYLSRRVSEWW